MKQTHGDGRKRLRYGFLIFSILMLLCIYQEYQYYLQQDVENMFFYGILIALSVLMLARAVARSGKEIGQRKREGRRGV